MIEHTIDISNYLDFDFSFLEENFYDVDKDRFFDRIPLKERLSSGQINYDFIKTEEQFYEKAMRFLTRIAYSLFEFITKEKTANVNFKTNSEHSFCGLTENIISIGIKILTADNIPKNTKVDILAGIIYHEMYHKRFTIFDIKESYQIKKYENFYKNNYIELQLKKILPTELHKVLNNILEDRRIEKLGAKDFPGYTFFFEEIRKYAAFLHYEKKFAPEFSEGILLDFILIKILIPELEEQFFKQVDLYEVSLSTVFPVTKSGLSIEENAVKIFKQQLAEIKKLLLVFKQYIEANKKTIFSSLWRDVLKETNNLYNLFPPKIKENIEKKLQEKKISYINIICEFGGESRNKGNPIPITSEQEARLKEIISDEIKKIESDLENNKKANIQNKHNEKVIPVNEHYKYYETVEMIEEPIEKFDSSLYNQAKKDAKNIFNNLGFLDSKFNRFIENYELTEGELDEDELYSIGFNNRHIFEEIEDLPGYNLDFGILLDESGSMSVRIREATLAVLSLILALKDNKHINLFVYGHTADRGFDQAFQIYKYYNTLDRFVDWRRIFMAKARGNNADGYAIDHVAKIMKKSKCKDKILCVVSDGQPAANGYGGVDAEAHVKLITTNLENEGIMVIQLCMAHIENSPTMFKHFIPYEKDGKFFDNLKKVLLTKLQQFANQV